MRLIQARIQYFKNYVEPQTVSVESDITCLVGKNESGKTTLLQAIHRVNPANKAESFNLIQEYPRWRLARDRRQNPNLESEVEPITLTYVLDDPDRRVLSKNLEGEPPAGTHLVVSRNYANEMRVRLAITYADLIAAGLAQYNLTQDTEVQSLAQKAMQEVIDAAKRIQVDQKEADPPRAKAWGSLATYLRKWADLVSGITDSEALEPVTDRIPRTFYFSSYATLPGEADLQNLSRKIEQGEALSPSENTVVALLRHAGEEPEDFLDEDYDSRKAELQAASVDLSHHAFEYWKQDTDLAVVFDTDNVEVDRNQNGTPIMHRLLKIQLRDDRHGGVETNFTTRSAGFRWYFSFFAAFSEYQDSDEPIVVLLDEPGTSLHGEAQQDFVRFIFDELGASKQTLYTTHSQHMVDPTTYEKIRAVHDRATKDDPDRGVAVTLVSLTTDRDTILPIESALGYSLSHHLFLGSGQHLAVEGSSDFVYLQRMTEHLVAMGQVGLDPRLAMIPVGSADNMPVFVALLGRRLRVSALIDGDRVTTKFSRVKAAAVSNAVPENAIIVCSDADTSLPKNADIEDLFEVDGYLKLYNWAFNANIKEHDLPPTNEPIVRRITIARDGEYNHALPAHALTQRRDEFFAAIRPKSAERFASLFELLNATIREG